MKLVQIILMALSVPLFAGGLSAQQSAPRGHSIYITAI